MCHNKPGVTFVPRDIRSDAEKTFWIFAFKIKAAYFVTLQLQVNIAVVYILMQYFS